VDCLGFVLGKFLVADERGFLFWMGCRYLWVGFFLGKVNFLM